MADEWKPLKSIEHLDGLNGLDIGSARFKEYMKLVQGITDSLDIKVGIDIECLGLKPGVAISLRAYPISQL
jgi:hypothetical protein